MNNIINKITGLILTLSFTSCTIGFEDLNIDPNNPQKVDPEYSITNAEFEIMKNIWDQWQNGRVGMLYSQYWAQPAYPEESMYQIRESANKAFWGSIYTTQMNLQESIKESENKNNLKPSDATPNRIAIAKIIQNYAYHIITDTYGDIPYSEALGGVSHPSPKYDDQSYIYKNLIANLEKQVSALDPSKQTFGGGEVIYKGDVIKWKKFANSIIVRIAIRMSDVEPDISKAAIEKAVASGVFTSNDDNALFKYIEGYPNNNPINEAWKTRQDFAVSTTFIKYLKSISDPRLPIYADTNKAGIYNGLTYGLNQSNAGQVKRDSISYPGKAVREETSPGIFMDYAELEFALSEAAQRGFNVGGSAESHYQNAITASMNFWGIKDDKIISDYISSNPYNASNWVNCIGTQKWIALYMQGIQGWLERIRLNFVNPKDGTPIFIAPKDGSLDANVKMVPTRMTYPVSEITSNPSGYATAIQKLGGSDSKGIPQWWNKNKIN